jgi:hypothetical protein
MAATMAVLMVEKTVALKVVLWVVGKAAQMA